MNTGKMASQAGHGFLGAFINAQTQTPAIAASYAADLPGTKVCLQGNLAQIERAQFELQQAGIPNFLVVDSGCPNFFNGEPTVTALGFGPATKQQVKAITKRMNIL